MDKEEQVSLTSLSEDDIILLEESEDSNPVELHFDLFGLGNGGYRTRPNIFSD
jgi:hypothetical protein